jgi:hypothetical protein
MGLKNEGLADDYLRGAWKLPLPPDHILFTSMFHPTTKDDRTDRGVLAEWFGSGGVDRFVTAIDVHLH